MKNLLFMFAVMMGVIACSGNATNSSEDIDTVAVDTLVVDTIA